MSLRVEVHGKLIVSDNPSALQAYFQSGDLTLVDTASYSKETSKLVTVPASASNQAVGLDGIVSAGILLAFTQALHLSITLVPTGSSLGACSPMKLLPGVPLVLGSDIAQVYVSNSDSVNPGSLEFGAAGN